MPFNFFKSVGKAVDPSDLKPLKGLDDVNLKPIDHMKPIDPSAPKPIEPNAPKPAGGSGLGTTIAMGGFALSSMIPSILNSSAISTAINAGAIAGTVENVMDQITSSPENMAVAGAVAVAVIFLLFK